MACGEADEDALAGAGGDDEKAAGKRSGSYGGHTPTDEICGEGAKSLGATALVATERCSGAEELANGLVEGRVHGAGVG